MNSFWISARLTKCAAMMLLIGYRGGPFSQAAYGQDKTATEQKTNESINRARQTAGQARQSSLSDDAIQKAIDSGRTTKAQALWKTIEKTRAVR